jgi:cytochrome c oxidase subunit 4
MSTQIKHKHEEHHILPVSTYVLVWIGLMILTGVTVGVYFVDFGPLNAAVAMMVAIVKASLVILFFMGLKYDKRFHSVAFGIGVLFFILFVAMMMLDVVSRTDPDPVKPFAELEKLKAPEGVSKAEGHSAAGEAKTEEKAAPAGETKPTEPAKPAESGTANPPASAKPADGAKPAEAAKPAAEKK